MFDHVRSLPPGTVIVVGPSGSVSFDEEGQVYLVGCDILTPSGGMSPAHKALVSERWEGWTDDGQRRLHHIDIRRMEEWIEEDTHSPLDLPSMSLELHEWFSKGVMP